jgi:hypothetical protein
VLTSSDEEDDIVVLAIRFCPQEADMKAYDPSRPSADSDPTSPDDLGPADHFTRTTTPSAR